MKTSDQQVEKSNDTLQHLTSGLLFPLQHGIMTEDLHCSWMLWEQSIYNIQATELAAQRTGKTYRYLLKLHQRPCGMGEDEMSYQTKFNIWKMLSDLIEYGPKYFCCFWEMLGELEVVEAIPVIQTPIVTAQSMHCINSTVSGNIESVTGLLAQARINDSMDTHNPEMSNISDYVMLFQGILGWVNVSRHSYSIKQWKPHLGEDASMSSSCWGDSTWRWWLQTLFGRHLFTQLQQEVTRPPCYMTSQSCNQ